MTSFGNAAVDIDILEQEISAKEQANRNAPAELSGNIAGMGGPSRPRPMQEVGLNDDLDTLDEPKRDLRTIGLKFGHVIFPTPDRQQLLRDWDLWGPLFICVGLSLLLQHNHPDGSAPQFTQVFAITFFGSIVVTLNIKLLGGQISFFQSLCVIGYCLLPPLVAALICSMLLHGKVFILRLVITSVGFCWSTFEVGLNDDLDTLDEPVWDTVKRDLRTIGLKFGHVIFPTPDRQQLLRDWDLWGPLFICVGLSLLLQHNHPDGSAPQFTQVFAITFFGSIVVTLNIKLLGGQISFFQSLCVIGYCLLPPLVAALICSMLLHGKVFILRLVITSVGFCWSTFAAMGFLAGCQPEKKRLLVVYPIFLFYFVVSWMIITNS
ncbi:Yip1 domain protein [Oesophagostomum dentatum]|uniref:Protein YIPF n=1 Tax=Oesophagostomum dentatum TaxID=61180 RepID=A0A0B1T0K9_OESDE|nr:Yip1 domain protein [Oesophagostomum dentatum]